MWNKTEKQPIGQFLLLTFLIAWGSELILIAGGYFKLLDGTVGMFITYMFICFGAGFAPAYAFYIVLKKHKKINGFKDFLKIVFKTGNRRRTLLITALIMLSQLVIYSICEQYRGNPWYYFILYIPLMIIGGGIEETGWRGFLQPALESKMPFAFAALTEGIIWSVWHLPLWLVPHTTQSLNNILSFSVYCVVFGFVLALAYKLTRSICAGVLIHAWNNVVFGGMFTLNSLINLPDSKTVVLYCLEVIAAISIVHFITERNAPGRISCGKV